MKRAKKRKPRRTRGGAGAPSVDDLPAGAVLIDDTGGAFTIDEVSGCRIGAQAFVGTRKGARGPAILLVVSSGQPADRRSVFERIRAGYVEIAPAPGFVAVVGDELVTDRMVMGWIHGVPLTSTTVGAA